MEAEKQVRIVREALLQSLVAVDKELSALTAPSKHANSASIARDSPAFRLVDSTSTPGAWRNSPRAIATPHVISTFELPCRV